LEIQARLYLFPCPRCFVPVQHRGPQEQRLLLARPEATIEPTAHVEVHGSNCAPGSTAPPGRLERPHPAPEAGALSAELRGRKGNDASAHALSDLPVTIVGWARSRCSWSMTTRSSSGCWR